MGRHAMELSYVLPDRKTVLVTSDGSGEGLFMFVADEAGKLDAGTLYAMRVYQTSSRTEPLSGDIEWVSLGHATDAEIRALLHPADPAQRITFEQLLATETPAAGACPTAGFKAVRLGNGTECLQLLPGMEKAASRLETRRYAAYLGATIEMNKEEGVTFDPDTKRVYLAISAVVGPMTATLSGGAPVDDGSHLQGAANSCGIVYAMDVGPWANAAGSTVTQYAPLNLYPFVVGVPASYPAGSPFEGNSCSVTGIASPDNVSYLPGYHTLIIGEDTDEHENDVIWSLNTITGKMTRIFTTPYGAETTSPYWRPNVGGYGYLMASVQHPYGEMGPYSATERDAILAAAPVDSRSGKVGVIGPFPALE